MDNEDPISSGEEAYKKASLAFSKSMIKTSAANAASDEETTYVKLMTTR
jgi:hypothetical protein